ncbi:hypothetical protein [Streptacidiphilus cavernicola]|uniref:Secreted protein n=1 Tax=Streptacidiphilus cavernicola TaxID=3342716 RepID=A0ABV6UL99_9ACTN
MAWIRILATLVVATVVTTLIGEGFDLALQLWRHSRIAAHHAGIVQTLTRPVHAYITAHATGLPTDPGTVWALWQRPTPLLLQIVRAGLPHLQTTLHPRRPFPQHPRERVLQIRLRMKYRTRPSQRSHHLGQRYPTSDQVRSATRGTDTERRPGRALSGHSSPLQSDSGPARSGPGACHCLPHARKPRT